MPISYTNSDYTDFGNTTLTGGAGGFGSNLGSADTSGVVADGSVLPDGSGGVFFVKITQPSVTADVEIIKVVARTGNALTSIVRGQGIPATTARSWTPGATMELVLDTASLKNMDAALVALVAQANSDATAITGKLSNDSGALTTDGSGQLTSTLAVSTKPSFLGYLSAVPAALQTIFGARVAGDSGSRAGLGVRSDGYGNLRMGNIATLNANLYAQSDGLHADNPLGSDITLSGATKTFARWKATDGKTFEFQIDTSGNFLIVNTTDSKTVLTISASGKISFGAVQTSTYAFLDHDSTNHNLIIETPQAGANHEYVTIYTWNGTTQKVLVQVGGSTNATSAAIWIDESGNLNVSGNGVFTGNFVFGPLVSGSQAFGGTDTTNHWTAFWTPQAGATHYSEIFVVWNGSAGVVALQLGGTTNNSGALVWIDENGNIHSGVQFIAVSSSAQSLATGNTITLPTGKGIIRTTNSGAITGIILTAGTDGQEVTVTNEGTGLLTFAASGTSHVADGTGSTIAIGTAASFVYVAATSLWYHCK